MVRKNITTIAGERLVAQAKALRGDFQALAEEESRFYRNAFWENPLSFWPRNKMAARETR